MKMLHSLSSISSFLILLSFQPEHHHHNTTFFSISLSLSLSLFKLSRWCNYEIENDVGNNNFEEKLSFVDSSS